MTDTFIAHGVTQAIPAGDFSYQPVTAPLPVIPPCVNATTTLCAIIYRNFKGPVLKKEGKVSTHPSCAVLLSPPHTTPTMNAA